jgi:hypothetical protein
MFCGEPAFTSPEKGSCELQWPMRFRNTLYKQSDHHRSMALAITSSGRGASCIPRRQDRAQPAESLSFPASAQW